MSKETKGAAEPPATSKETTMTTLTSLLRPAPAIPLPARRPVLRSLVVVCVSAIVAAGFLLDVAGGAQPRSRDQVVQPAIYLT